MESLNHVDHLKMLCKQYIFQVHTKQLCSPFFTQSLKAVYELERTIAEEKNMLQFHYKKMELKNMFEVKDPVPNA